MITDVFAGEPGELREYARAGWPDPQGHGLPTVRARRLDPVALAVLDMLLSGASADEALTEAVRSPMPEPDLYAGPVVTTFGSRIVQYLPAVAPDRLGLLVEDWLRCDEMAWADSQAVGAWLAEMQVFCREQVGNGRLLFVWNCL